MKKTKCDAWLNGERKEIDLWIYDDADYELPEFKKPKSMTNIFLLLLSLAITVLVGLYLYFQ